MGCDGISLDHERTVPAPAVAAESAVREERCGEDRQAAGGIDVTRLARCNSRSVTRRDLGETRMPLRQSVRMCTLEVLVA
jgi:hypothetical protein